MNTATISTTRQDGARTALSTIVVMVLLAGTADILAALLQYYVSTGKNPAVVLKFIASAIFGKQAFSGGNDMILWGLFFHYTIVLIWTIVFFFSFPLFFPFIKNRWLFAVLVALIIWLVMNLVVLPLSHTPQIPIRLPSALTALTILFLAVGIPFSFLLYRHHRRMKC